MLSKLLIFLCLAHLAFAHPTGHHPPTLIEDSVNLVTGVCHIFTQDMVVRGAEPITINRLYRNGTRKKKYAGWIYIPHLRLYYEHFDTSYGYVHFKEPQGNEVRFNMPDKKEDDYFDLKIELFDSMRNLGISESNTISGKSNLNNIKVKMHKHRDDVFVKSANGCWRYYKYRPGTRVYETQKYLLQWEDLPSGNRIKYYYDKDGKISLIKTVNPSNEKVVFAQCKIKKFTDDNDCPHLSFQASDNQITSYLFEYHDDDKERYQYTLKNIDSQEKPIETYTYTDHKKRHRGRLIESQTIANKKNLTFNYYEIGENPTQWHNYVIKKKDDFLIDRVREILENDTVIYTFHYGVEEDRSGWTKVYDVEGNVTVYHYNTLYQIVKIQRYDKPGHLLNTELYIYDKRDHSNDLLAAITLDHTGVPLVAKTYAYDHWGNIIEETVWGDITGRSTNKLTLDANSFPINNGVDKCTKTYRHSQDGRNLLLYEKLENGLEIIYDYYHESFLIKAKYIKFNNTIRKRTFYEYNNDHILTIETEDDGSSQDKDNLTSVTERHLYRTHPILTDAFYGMPEWIEESYIDLATKQEMPIVKTELKYYPNGKVKEKRVYNNQNKLAYTQTYEYDEHNNLISETNPLGRESTATYNDLHKKETFTDFDGLVKHTFQYDDLGRLYEITHTDTDGTKKTEQIGYDDKNRCKKKIDSYGNTTSFTYDALGNCTETLLPTGIYLKKTYNDLSQQISQTDGNGYATRISPNIFNKPLEIRHPDGTKETYRYNLDGTLAEAIQPHGTSTRYTYDHFQRVTSTAIYSPAKKLLTEETTKYNTYHPLTKTDPLGDTITYTYDYAGRKITETDGLLTTYFGYDLLDRPSTTTTGSCTKKTTYDFLDRVTDETITTPEGTVSTISYDYDRFNNKTTTTRSIEGNPAVTLVEYDHYSRPIRQTDPLGYITIITYNDRHLNPQGQFVLCKTEHSPNGNKTIEIYDILTRLSSREILSPFNTLLSRTLYHYDHNNNCIKQIDTITQDNHTRDLTTLRTYTPTNKIDTLTESHGTKEQKTTTYHYDTSGRLHTITDPNGTKITYTYDDLSRISTLITTNVSYRYHYDALSRITEVEDLIHHTSTTRSYDAQGNLTSETLGNGLTLTNHYDTQNRRTLLTLPDQTTITYTYDSYYLRSITRNNYTHEFLTYDLSGNLLTETSATHHYNLNNQKDEIHTPTLIQTVTDRDPLGNVLSQTTNSTTEHFTYSPLSQLTSEPDHQYTYDSLHNRTSKDSHPYLINNANQLTSTDTAQYFYDTAGYPHLKKSAQPITYTYDGLGRLIEATSPTFRITYVYDSFHRRLSRTVYHPLNGTLIKHQNFLYDDTNEIGSTDENHTIHELRILKDSSQAEIGAAIALELNSITYIPVHDLQGNIRALLHNDTQIESTTYTAYGETSQPSFSPWTFRSKRLDPELNLIFFGRRYYDPETGRFFTPDPKGFVDGLNLYAYCHNNPLNKIDLYGLNIHIEMSLTTAVTGLNFARSFIGDALYHTAYHCIPIPHLRFGLMALGNLISWKNRPIRSPNSSFNLIPGHKPSNSSLFFTNGIRNDQEDAKESAYGISRSAGSQEVTYFHSTTRGFISDILSSIWAKMGFQTGESNQMAEGLRTQLQHLRETSNDPKLFFEAHSRGGAYLWNALRLLTPEERKMIHVYTFGSASLFSNCGLASLTHFVAEGDPVPMLDPLNYLKARFFSSESSNVQILPGQGPLWERHSMSGQTYSRRRDIIGDKIMRNSGGQ